MKVRLQGELEIEQKGQSCKGNMQDDTAMQDELLKQLHEQYAVNNNANLSTIVTLVVAVIAVIGYFGYVYVHTGVDFSDNFGCLAKENEEFYLDALLLVYIASVSVLAILTHLCIYQGVAQRKEQFIIDAIRCKYLGEDYLELKGKDKIFPKGYHPYDKEGLKIVQGLYGELVKIFIGILCVLTFGVVLKLCANITNPMNVYIHRLGVFESFVCVVAIVALWHWCKAYYDKNISSYESRQEEYPDRKRKLSEKDGKKDKRA